MQALGPERICPVSDASHKEGPTAAVDATCCAGTSVCHVVMGNGLIRDYQCSGTPGVPAGTCRRLDYETVNMSDVGLTNRLSPCACMRVTTPYAGGIAGCNVTVGRRSEGQWDQSFYYESTGAWPEVCYRPSLGERAHGHRLAGSTCSFALSNWSDPAACNWLGY